jgi:dTDP-4-dehydrorhamnose 3,5-epimerase
MRFSTTSIADAWLIEPEAHSDDRGHFARTFCAREFAERGLDATVAQTSVSYNRARGTVRGMHWSVAPAAEAKMVRVTRGAIHDVVVDLRDGGGMRSLEIELSAVGGVQLYIPAGCAHGFQTLADDTEVAYQMNVFFDPACARGARWDDPALSVNWPLPVAAISEKDLAWPAYERQAAAAYQR